MTVTDSEPAMPTVLPSAPPIAKISTSFGASASIDTPRNWRPVASSISGVPAFAAAETVARPSIHASVLLMIVTLVIEAPTLAPPDTAICPAMVPPCAALRAFTRTLPAACTAAAPATEALTVSMITLTVAEPAIAALLPAARPIEIESIEPVSFALTSTLPLAPPRVSTVEVSIVAVIVFAMKLPDRPTPTAEPLNDTAAPPVSDLMLELSSASTLTSPFALTLELPMPASTVSEMPLIASAPAKATFLPAAPATAAEEILPSSRESCSDDSAFTLTDPNTPDSVEPSMRALTVLNTEFQPNAPPKPLPCRPMPTAPPTACIVESSCASRLTEAARVSVELTICATSVLWIRLMPIVNAAPSS